MILISNFTKISPMGVELFHADIQTDGQKLMVTFRNFANARNKVSIKSCRKNQNTRFVFNSFLFNRAVYKTMWKKCCRDEPAT